MSFLHCTGREAVQLLFDYIVSMTMMGQVMSAKDACTLCWWAERAGAAGPLKEIAVRPDSTGGHFSRKFQQATGQDEKT